MNGKFGNYFSALDSESGADEELSHVGRMFKDSKISRIHIDHHFDEKEADPIRKGLIATTTLTQLDLTNYIPIRIVQAISEGLKQNKSITKISYRENYDEQAGDTLPQDSTHFLRDIFSIPRISYQIDLRHNSSVLQIINGENANYLKNLTATVGSAQLDELLYGLRDNKVLVTMDIELKRDNVKSKNLSLFGNLKRLASLKIQLRDEFEQFFTALQHIDSLKHLDLSNSYLTTDGACHLADLIVKLRLTSLKLTNCSIGNKQFSIICHGILKNNTITSFNVQDNPFDRLDLVDQTLTERKKIVTFETDTFDVNMAKLFDITNLSLYSFNFDGLKAAKIQWFTVTKKVTEISQVTDLFNALNYTRQIYSLRLFELEGEEILCEFCKQLAYNKTLKSVDITYATFGEKSFKMFCELIETNNTLQTLTHDGTFTIIHDRDLSYTYIPHGPLLEALKKNTNLTSVDFYRLHCEDWEVEDVLEANPYLTFTQLADRTRGSRASKLNSLNQRNINRRLRDIKCTVMTLARSYLAILVPFELWQLILDQVSTLNVDFFDLFKQSLRNK